MEDIASLATRKSFAELDSEEQQQVLTEMTAYTYDQLHLILCSARSLEADVAPPPGLALRLQERMAQKNRPAARERNIARIIHFRIPVWQAAAALLVVFALARFWKTPDARPVPAATVVQTIVKTDTILLEKVQWKERIVFRERSASAFSTPVKPQIIQEKEESLSTFFENKPTSEIVLETSVQGLPIGEQPELFQFFTQPAEGGKRF